MPVCMEMTFSYSVGSKKVYYREYTFSKCILYTSAYIISLDNHLLDLNYYGKQKSILVDLNHYCKVDHITGVALHGTENLFFLMCEYMCLK
jgi:hypothetical protein